MCTKFIVFFLFHVIFCSSFLPNMSEIFNKTAKDINLTDISKIITNQERNFFRLYRNANRLGQMTCEQLEKNINSLQDMKTKYDSYVDMIENCIINKEDEKKLLELRGDILFGRQNIDIAIKKLNNKKKDCFNNSDEIMKYINEQKQKNKKSKEQLIRTVNQIIQMENGL